MKVKKKSLKEYFRDYQLGRLNKDENQIIDDWFSIDIKDEIKAPANTILGHTSSKEEMYNNINFVIRQKSLKKNNYLVKWLSVACLLTAFITGAFLVNNSFQNKSEEKLSWKSYQTSAGEVKQISLPDGTKVWMNANTKIQLRSDFNAVSKRTLRLDFGEAFFQVKRDTSKLFSITTGKITTTVLGTSFNIRTYPEMDTYKIAVASGKVKVDFKNGKESRNLAAHLTKDQVLKVDAKSGSAGISTTNVSLIGNWRLNRSIYLDELTLPQIGQELSRQFKIDVKVTGGPNPNQQRYTLTLRHQDLPTVLRQLVLQTGMNYQLNNKMLTINPSR
ncbi:MAG: FecR family protein [Flavobacterium sp.]|nr:MAG: FecR family protein [Flavobacterium sp.]